MHNHLEAGTAQLQSRGLDAVVQGQAADQNEVYVILPEKLDHARAALLGQVVIAGAVRVQVRLNAFHTK